jgi:LacI family transcriptional regulator
VSSPTPITQSQIAKELNISRSTVAAVLSNSPTARISPLVGQKVMMKAAEVNYRPNRYAQIVRKGTSGTIGIINFGGIQQSQILKLHRAARAISQAGYEPLVQDIFWFTDGAEQACTRMLEARVEGIILLAPSLWFTNSHLDRLLDSGIPVVALGGSHLKNIPVLLSDKKNAFCKLTEHALKLGYRRLTLLIGKDSSDTEQQTLSWHARSAKEGFLEALENHPRSGARGNIHAVYHSLDLEDETGLSLYHRGEQGMREILQEFELPEAVVCSNDNWALGAMRAYVNANMRVPEDIAILGCENEPAGEVGLQPLTTVAAPIHELADRAVEMVIGAMKTGHQLKPEIITMPGQLIVRRSCGQLLKAQQFRSPSLSRTQSTRKERPVSRA